MREAMLTKDLDNLNGKEVSPATFGGVKVLLTL